jgi:hypothetical protein
MEMTVTNGAWNYLVITDHALVVVEWKSREEDQKVVIGGAFGALGASLSAADGGLLGTGRTSVLGLDGRTEPPPFLEIHATYRCRAGDVPKELGGHRRWPSVGDTRPVVIYPRSVISHVRVRWWGSYTISFNYECPDYRDGMNIWDVPRARRHLERSYPIF